VRKRSIVIVLAIVLVGILLVCAGCGGGGNETTTTVASPSGTETVTTPSATTASTEPETTTTTGAVDSSSTEPEATTTTEQLSSAETLLPSGHIKAMGFIDKVWEEGGKRYISIDYAEWLTGQEAVDAAAAAGYTIAPGEDEYWIRNDNPQKRVFEVADTAPITGFSTTRGEVDQPIAWDTFMSLWSTSPPTDTGLQFSVNEAPWWIERDGQTVVKIDQQYVP
jgi:hypothetical protein